MWNIKRLNPCFIVNLFFLYYNVENKDIVDEVLQDKLFELDPNWIDYGKEKSKQKRKSN